MIRPAQKKDISAILNIYAPYVRNTTITFEYSVPSPEEFTQRFESVTEQFPWLVWEENGEILGYVYASAPFARAAYAWCAEPSVYLKPEARGRGIGTALYRALEEILKLQGYQILYTLITDENTQSVDFHTKNGYIHRAHLPDCGFKFDRWVGIYWMEKRLKSVEIPSTSPRPWPVIVQETQKNFDFLDKLSIF